MNVTFHRRGFNLLRPPSLAAGEVKKRSEISANHLSVSKGNVRPRPIRLNSEFASPTFGYIGWPDVPTRRSARYHDSKIPEGSIIDTASHGDVSQYSEVPSLSNKNAITSAMSKAVIENATKVIPAVVHMISGCQDEQTSADVSNVQAFSLPNPQGRAGGALTAALLNVAYADHKNTGKDLSFEATLLQVREMLKQKGFSQIPQLSSSRPMDISAPFDIVPEK